MPKFIPTLLLFTLFWVTPSFGQELTNEEKCNSEIANSERVKTALTEFKKDCDKYPSKLIHLIDNPKTCKNRKKKGSSYIEDTPANRKLLSGFFYKSAAKTFELKNSDCPN